jgi:hydroxyacylglutathione hydrolase
LKVKKLILGIYSVNCYIVTLVDNSTLENSVPLENNAIQESGQNSCFIIDPGADFKSIDAYITGENLRPEFILNTHGHFDHLGAAPEVIAKYKIPFYLHKDDESIALNPKKNMSSLLGPDALSFETYNLIDDKILDLLEEYDIYIYEMPGHTPGSIIIKMQNYLFTGDLLFRGAVGRTDLPGGSSKDLALSLRKLKKFSPELIVNPGHGAVSTLKNEFVNNYYLSDDFLEGGINWF